MKKYLAILLAISLSLSFAACVKPAMDNAGQTSSGLSQSQPGSTGTTESQISIPPTETSAPPAQTQPPAEGTKPPETTVPTEGTKPTEPAHTHNYSGNVTKAATCTADGVKTYACACGDSYTETISATGHSWSEWTTTKAPTTTAEGNLQRKCQTCKTTENKPIPVLPPSEPSAATVTQEQLEKIKEGFFELVNLERNRLGVHSLTANAYLDSCGQIRSVEITTLFSHTRPDGQPFSTVVDSQDYPYYTLGENLCITSHVGDGTYTSADKWVGSDAQIQAASAWIFYCFKNSPGHYASMISADFKECGIGITYRMHDEILPMFYVAHLFGSK